MQKEKIDSELDFVDRKPVYAECDRSGGDQLDDQLLSSIEESFW